MLATRKLDLKLIEKLLPQLENEEFQAEIELELAEKAVFLARLRRDEAHDHVLQMRGEYDSAQEILSPPILIGDGETPNQNSELAKAEQPKKGFWDAEGFSWRQFLQDLIGSEGMPMTYNDVVTTIKLTEEEGKKLNSTISSALSHLAKLGTLQSYTLPGVRGQFYGLSSYFENGSLKTEYFNKIAAKAQAAGVPIAFGSYVPVVTQSNEYRSNE